MGVPTRAELAMRKHAYSGRMPNGCQGDEKKGARRRPSHHLGSHWVSHDLFTRGLCFIMHEACLPLERPSRSPLAPCSHGHDHDQQDECFSDDALRQQCEQHQQAEPEA